MLIIVPQKDIYEQFSPNPFQKTYISTYNKLLAKENEFNEVTVFSSAAFKIVKSWLGPEAVSLLKFTSKNEVQDYVSVEYLPPHMGGTVSIVLGICF